MTDTIAFSEDFYTRQFHRWCDAAPSFAAFVDANSSKIAAKIRRAGDLQQEIDILAELETAKCLLVNARVQIDYEAYGTEDANPDLRVSFDGASACVEVKRVRPSDASARHSAYLTDLVQHLRAIPSSLAVSISNYDCETGPNYARFLCDNKDRIFADCEAALKNAAATLNAGESSRVTIPDADGLLLEFHHLADKDPSLPTSYFGGVEPLLYTQRESFKFTDQLCKSLRQLRSDSANVLVLRLSSNTHEPEELFEALHELQQCVGRRDDSFFQNKKFDGVNDFLNQVVKLSAACVIPHTYSETILWTNANSTHRLPDAIATLFRFTVAS